MHAFRNVDAKCNDCLLAMQMRASCAQCFACIQYKAQALLRNCCRMNPFVITKSVTVHGGCLKAKEPWTVMVQGIGGDDFFVLDKSDRAFAKAMGMNVSIPNPFKTAFCFQELAKKRDAAVDALIMAHIHQNDPMADESIATLVPKNRAKAYADANVPQTLAIVWPAFVTADGARWQEHSVFVVTTPRRGVKVTMHLTEPNLEWLMAAIPSFADDGSDAKASGDPHVVDLLQPACKWRKLGAARTPVIQCTYMKADGVWKSHTITPRLYDDAELTLRSVREAENKMQAFYDAHHCDVADDEVISE
jgi:hypothetical protein